MASYTQLTYHIIFGTKQRRPLITTEIKARLYEYTGGLARSEGGQLLNIGGVDDHIHLLVTVPATKAVSDFVRLVKANSSKWVRETFVSGQSFAWQKGYSAFTVSHSQIVIVSQYIENQEEHHRRRSFREEYVALLERHGIEHVPEYVFEDEHTG